LIRTPLRLGSATLWADPELGVVRFSTRNRTRTLLAGLHPSSYLVATEDGVLVAVAGSDEALAFSVATGASAAVGRRPKPAWCVAVEELLPAPLRSVEDWLEVGLRGGATTWSCSIPRGLLPHLQIRLRRYGQQVTYITRIRLTNDDRD
jgi:hypothetical protein